MTGEPMHTASKIEWCRAPQLSLSSEKLSIHYAALLAMFNPLYNITNQELFEKHLCNQSSHYEKYGRFLLQRKAVTCYRKSTPFAVSKDKWDTKEDTKS